MSNLKDKLWVAKYAPKNFKETIMPKDIKDKMMDFVKTKNIPNLGLFGPAGTGKTSSGRALLTELGVDIKGQDVMFINASDVNSVDDVRNIIKPFAMAMSNNEELPIRFVFLDEADHLSPQAQAALRNLIESAYNSARFILTANYPKKIISALHSRLQTFTLQKPDLESIFERVVTILEAEDVTIDSESELVKLIEDNSTDIRKLIQLLEQNTTTEEDGTKLLKVSISDSDSNPNIEEYIQLFKGGDRKALKNLVYGKFTDTDANEFWSRIISDIVKNPNDYEEIGMGIDNTIYHLNEGQKNHEMVADKLLNIIGFTIMAMDTGE